MVKRCNHREMIKFATKILIKNGLYYKHALIVAKVLVEADLEGISSHGISRLSIYTERIQKGAINRKPQIKLDYKFPALGIMNADNCLGHIAGYYAMKDVINKANKYGIAAMGVKNSNHFGLASYYTNMAMKKELIGFVISNGPPAIPPWGGSEPYFGTNPLAVSFPGGNLGPVSIDMATSIIARGKIIKAAREGKKIKRGLALDIQGKPTNDPEKALKGCILPMGGPKGAAIAMAIEIMAGVLTGAGFGKNVIWQYSKNSKPSNVGHYFCALNPEGFLSLLEYKKRMDSAIKEMKELSKAEGITEIRIPGERRRRNYIRNKKLGIKITPEVFADLKTLAKKFDVLMPRFKEEEKI